MTRLIIKTLYSLSMCCLLLLSTGIFLFATTPGLYVLLRINQHYLPGTIETYSLEGSMWGNSTIEKLVYQNKTQKLTIEKLQLQWQPQSLWKPQLISIRWHNLTWQREKAQTVSSVQGRINATARLPKLQIDLNTPLAFSPQEHWRLSASLDGIIPWNWTVNAYLRPEKSENLHASITIKGYLSAKDKGQLQCILSAGSYQLPDQAKLSALEFQRGLVTITLSHQQLSGQGKLVIDQDKNLRLQFKLPKFVLGANLNQQQITQSSISLDLKSLAFLQALSPELTGLKGHITASITANGTLEKPRITSSLQLSNTSLFIPRLGLHLDNIELRVDGKERQLELNGYIDSAGHNLQITGQGSLDSGVTADISLFGDNFPFMNTSEYQVSISPKIKLRLTPTAYELSGSVLIPRAQIKPQNFTNSISLSDDVIYKKSHQKIAAPQQLHGNTDVSISMGDEVAIDIKGLKGLLRGTLNFRQQPQGAIQGYGELSVKNGTYKAYGQDLNIQQGQLIFTGGPVNNPGIHVRAAKKINNTPSTFSSSTQLFDFNTANLQSVNLGDSIVLGVEVTGRLSKPKIQLFSNPAILSQADILSMLVLGRPASQANKAGGQLLLAAISSMNLGGNSSTQLLEQLRQNAGLDFNVQTNTNYNQLTNTVNDSTAFVLGKSLSKRLYLSYNIGLAQTDTNMLTLKYILNQFFSIQISNSDTSSAIDILYTANKKATIRSKDNSHE